MDAADALAIGHKARRVALGTLERKLTPSNPIVRLVGSAAANPEDSARADELWDEQVRKTVAEAEERGIDGELVRSTLETLRPARRPGGQAAGEDGDGPLSTSQGAERGVTGRIRPATGAAGRAITRMEKAKDERRPA